MEKRNSKIKSSPDSRHSFYKPVPRRCRKRVRPPDIAKNFVKKRVDQNGFLVKYINNFIGRGVFADREFEQGEFLLEYSGKLLSGDAATGMIDTDYTYHFEFKGENKCIDATKEPSDGPSLCRLVNHGDHKKHRNANMKYVEVEGIPHLCLFSTRRILQGEEILYDYGVKNLPWQKQKKVHADNGALLAESSNTDENQSFENGSTVNMAELNPSGRLENEEYKRQNADSGFNVKTVNQSSVSEMQSSNTDVMKGQSADSESEDMMVHVDNGALLAESLNTYENQSFENESTANMAELNPSGRLENEEYQRQNADSGFNVKTVNQSSVSEKQSSYKDVMKGQSADSESEDMMVHVDNGALLAESLNTYENQSFENESTANMAELNPSGRLENEEYQRQNADSGFNIKTVNQSSVSEKQSSYKDVMKGQSADSESEDMMASSRRKPTRKQQRKDPYDYSDSDIELSDDSFIDPSYVPSKDNISASDDESDPQIKSAHTSQTKKLKFKPGKQWTKLRPDDDFINNSESDISVASEIYPLLSNQFKATEEEMVPKMVTNEQYGIGSASLSKDKSREAINDKNLREKQTFDENVNDDWKVYEESDGDESRDDDGEGDEETDGVTIRGTTAYIDGRRVVDKRHCCVFCGILDYRLPRHYKRHHSEHPIIVALKDKSEKERDREYDKLRLEGDFKHNLKVLRNNKGSLILPRRPSKDDELRYTFEDYLHCEYCKGFYLRNNLWRHQKKCQFKSSVNVSTGKRGRPQRNSVLLMETVLPQNKEFKPGFIKNVISTLHVDDVSNIIKKDDIIMRVGNFMYDKHAKSQRDYMSQELRLLGRLVKALREEFKNPTGHLKDFLRPKNFDGIVEAAKSLSMKEETEDSIVLKKYSVALKCGPSLNKCCIIMKGIARRASDEESEKEAQRLQDLISDEWSGKITSVALRSRKELKRNEVILLPIPADLMKLKHHIDNEIKLAYEKLKDQNDCSEWFQKLQAAILCRIIMFNRRRSGETSKILLKDYLLRPNWRQSVNDEIYQSLGSLEKELIKRLDMIALKGKKDRPVTIIVTPEIKAGLELLVKCRPYNIEIDNPFLFARASGENNIRGSKHMREFANKAGLQYPERIGSTNMRKYIATVVQMLNLNEGELEWLSNHLGHTIEVHKEYYRNQGAAIQLGKVAKTLIAMDQGHTLSSLQEDDLPDDIVTEGLSEDEDDDEDDNLNDNGIVEMDEHCSRIDAEAEDPKLTLKKMPKVKPWTADEMKAIKRSLQGYVNTLTCPGKTPCMEAIVKEPALKGRDWKSIKYKVAYLIFKRKQTPNKQKKKKEDNSKKK